MLFRIRGMTGTYAIDRKKQRAQAEDPIEAPKRISVDEAIDRLFVKSRPSLELTAGPGAEDAVAFVNRFYEDPGLRTKTPSRMEQEALFPVVTRSMDPSAWLSLFAGWSDAKGLMELVFGEGRYARGVPIDKLVVDHASLSRWDLWKSVRFALALDPSARAWLLARCKGAELGTIDAIPCALAFDDCAWGNTLADRLLAQPMNKADSFHTGRIFGVVDDPVRFSKLVAFFDGQMQWIGRGCVLGRAVGRIPAEVLERELLTLLDRGRAAKWKSSEVEPYAKALAHIRSPEVASSLAAWLGEKAIAKIATDYFRAHPDLSSAALDGVSKGKSKAAPIARAILDSLGRSRGGDANEAPEQQDSGASPAKRKRSKVAPTEVGPAQGSADLPSVLRDPPWARKKGDQSEAHRPTLALTPIVENERCPAEPKPWAKPLSENRTPESDQKLLGGRSPAELHEAALFSLTDEAGFRAIAERAQVGYWSIDRILLWQGERVVPHVIRFIAADIDGCHPLLARAVSPRLALPCAKAALQRSGGPGRAASLAWLRRHPEEAALGLIPAALGDDETDADLAERALRFLVRAGSEAVVTASAARYGGEAAAAMARLLTRDPHERFPHKMPPKAKWAAPDRVGAPTLKAGGALTAEHTANLISMLQISEIGEPYVGAVETLALLTDEARNALAQALISEYLLAGSPPSHAWVIGAVALLAPDVAIQRLRTQMRAWAADGKVALLHTSLHALSAIGSDEALIVVYDAGQRSRYDDTRDEVRRILEDVARSRGISYAVLEDLLVPELGLEHGAVVLDLGPRTLSVRLGDHLEAILTDAEGKVLPAFPRKSNSDDAESYERAKRRHAALLEAAESVGRTQVLRFERALREQRTWTVGGLRAHLLTQPLVRHLVGRLVWQVAETDVLFRVAEDLTLADGSDDAVAFPPDETPLVLAHPLRAPGLSRFVAWLEHYRVIQPFSQVTRETYALTDEERATTTLTRVVGRKASYLAVLALTLGMGWKPVSPGEAGIDAITQGLPGGYTARLALKPGLLFGAAKGRPEQTLGTLALTNRDGAPAPFAALDLLSLSELLRDVSRLA